MIFLSFNSINLSLEIIHEDENLIAINKPHGLLVHRSRIASDATEFAVQMLRDQIGQYVYPVHRLDRKTSGVLLFAKSKEVNTEIQKLFSERKVVKKYLAIVRGFTDEKSVIDYALTEGNKTQEAKTDYRLIKQFEIDLPFGRHDTSRYSLVELTPLTGRFHQLRKHMAHIFHPIIGDRPHGCNKQNKLWKEQFDMMTMMLHAKTLSLEYPISNELTFEAEPSQAFKRALTILSGEQIDQMSDHGLR